MVTEIDINTLSPEQILQASVQGWHRYGNQAGNDGLENQKRLREEGVKSWNSWISGKPPEERRKLGNYQTNLCGLDLPDLDFSWVNGYKARLFGSNLARGNFQFANLSWAHMEGIEAPSADFRGARLNMAHFTAIGQDYKNHLHPTDNHLKPELPLEPGKKANLRGADFRGANLFGTFFHEADLRRANFSGAHIESTHFKDTDLTGANFDRKQVEEHLDKLLEARTRAYGGFLTFAQILRAADIDPDKDRAAAVNLVDKLLTTDRYLQTGRGAAHHR